MKIIFKLFILFVCMFFFNANINSAVIYQGTSGTKSYSSYTLYTEIKKAKFGTVTRNMYCSQFYRQAPPKGNSCTKINWGHGEYSLEKNHRDGIAAASIFENVSSYGDREILLNAYLALADGPSYEYKCKSGYCVAKYKGTVKSELGTDGNSKNYYISIDHKDYSTSSLKTHIINLINGYIKQKFINYNKFYNIKLNSTGLKYNSTTKKHEMTVNFKNSNSSLISWYGNSSTYKGDDKWINSNYTITINTHTNLTSCVINNKSTSGFKVTCDPVNLMANSNLKVSVKLSYKESFIDRYDCDGADVNTYQLMVDSLPREIDFEKTLEYSSSNQMGCDEIIKGKTPSEKIKIYQYYLNQGINYNKILDFNNSSCSAVNCTSFTSKKVGCSSSSIVNNAPTFNALNLSCYKETENVSGNIAYCTTDFALNTSALSTLKKSYIDAGRVVLTDANQSNLGGNFIKTCYLFDAGATTSNMIFRTFNYKNYISKVLVNDEDLLKTATFSPAIDSVSNDSGGSKKYVRKYNFSLNKKNYILKMSGKTTTDTSCINKGTCLNIYGLIIKYTSIGIGDFNPKVEIGNTYTSSYGISSPLRSNEDACKAIIEDEKRIIIPYDTPQRINLQYRIIDTLNPFPGKSGAGRMTGSNWCFYTASGKNCMNNNLTVATYILNKNNSYNKQKKSPIYQITLTPTIIKNIRNYNKTTTYKDYKISCDINGKNCTNDFLRNYNLIR